MRNKRFKAAMIGLGLITIIPILFRYTDISDNVTLAVVGGISTLLAIYMPSQSYTDKRKKDVYDDSL